MMLESSADGDKFYYRGEYVTVYDGVGYSGNGSPVPLPLLPSSYYSYDARMQMMQPLPVGINITPGSWQRINFNFRIPSLGNLFDKSGFRMRGIMSYNWNFSIELPVWRFAKGRRYESSRAEGYSDNYSLLMGLNGPSQGEQGARGVVSLGGDGWHPPKALDAIGVVDTGYNLTLAQFANVPNGLNYFGTGLSFLSTSLTGYGVYRQYQKGGLRSVNPFQFTSFTVGSTALLSKSLEWAGYRSMVTSVIGRSAGIFGLGIVSIEQWFNFYKSMDNLRYAPSYIDGDGNPYYGDPITEPWNDSW
jgi:hypothetical protein